MKRGQFQISFGMLFSIILIIAFVAVAIYVIMFFLKMKKCSEISLFVKDLQEEIDRAWSSEESDFLFTRSLPSGIKKVRFIDLSKERSGKENEDFEESGYSDVNMFFYPIKKSCKGLEAKKLKHINITAITKIKNPYCIKNEGKVTIKIEKGFYERDVRLKAG